MCIISLHQNGQIQFWFAAPVKNGYKVKRFQQLRCFKHITTVQMKNSGVRGFDCYVRAHESTIVLKLFVLSILNKLWRIKEID